MDFIVQGGEASGKIFDFYSNKKLWLTRHSFEVEDQTTERHASMPLTDMLCQRMAQSICWTFRHGDMKLGYGPPKHAQLGLVFWVRIKLSLSDKGDLFSRENLIALK